MEYQYQHHIKTQVATEGGRKGSRRGVLGFIRIDYTVIEKAVRFKKHNGMVKRLRYSSSKNNGMHAQKKKRREKHIKAWYDLIEDAETRIAFI